MLSMKSWTVNGELFNIENDSGTEYSVPSAATMASVCESFRSFVPFHSRQFNHSAAEAQTASRFAYILEHD